MIVLERIAARAREENPMPDRETANDKAAADAWKWVVALLAAELDRQPAADRRTIVDALLRAEGNASQQRLAHALAAKAGAGGLDLYLPMMFPDFD
jgi:hypothetical protein